MIAAVLKNPSVISKFISKRYLSSVSVSPKYVDGYPNAFLDKQESLKVSTLDNGIKVASYENNSPITRIAVVMNVGCRDEDYNELGSLHALRIFANLATKNYSKFGLTRILDQCGSNFSVSSSREQIAYILENSRDQTFRCIEILGDIISKPELRHWEIKDSLPRFKFDLDLYQERPEIRIVDLIHKASFKNGLSNSLYAPKANVQNLDSRLLSQFRDKHFSSDRMYLIGTGISHDNLVRYAKYFRLSNSNKPFSRTQSVYYPNEIREENFNKLVHVAIGYEGTSISSKDRLTSLLVSNLFGSDGSHIKFSTGSNRLSKSCIQLASEPVSIKSFSANYTDTGLFGFQLIANYKDIGKVVQGLYKEFNIISKSGLTDKEVEIAKYQLKASLFYSVETDANLLGKISVDLNSSLNYMSPSELSASIDALTTNNVNQFIKKIALQNSSLAAIGNLTELPRLKELTA